MIRKRIAGGLLAIMAASTIAASMAPMAMAAPAAPAHIAAPADTNGQPDPDPDTLTMDISVPLCESSGHNYCLGDGGGTQFLATHANATPVKFNYNHNTFTWGGVTYNVGTLNEPSQSPACLGFNGNGNITRQNCSTGTGIIWGAGLSNGHHVWINRLKTQQQNGVFVLAASDGLNSLLFTSLYPPGPTVFERWTSG